MIKELTIAIILGAVIGFGATSGIISLKNNSNPSQNAPSPTDTPTTQDSDSSTQNPHTLSIQKPDNEIVTDTDKIDIVGTTTPNSQVVVHGQTDTFFITSDDSGQFSQSMELIGGVNLIQISSISPDEQQLDIDLTITYSTVDF